MKVKVNGALANSGWSANAINVLSTQIIENSVAATSVEQGRSNGFIVRLSVPSIIENKVKLEKQKTTANSEQLNVNRISLKEQQKSFASKFKTISKKGKVTGKVENVLNAIFLNNEVTPDELQKLKKLPEVQSITQDYVVYTNLNDSVPLINANDVWKLDTNGNDCAISGQECLTGKGITIGIIDTGVDYTHPSLGGCTTEQFLSGNCEKVIWGFDFVNSYDGNNDGDYDDPEDIKGSDPMDDMLRFPIKRLIQV